MLFEQLRLKLSLIFWTLSDIDQMVASTMCGGQEGEKSEQETKIDGAGIILVITI